MKPNFLSLIIAHWRYPVLVVLYVLCISSLSAKSLTESCESMKRIPIVSYQPGQLQNDVLNSFVEVPYTDCFFTRMEGDSVRYFWRTNAYRRDALCYDTINAKMRLSEIQSRALLENDSAFIFDRHTEYGMTPQFVDCVGFVRNNNIWFVFEDRVIDFPNLTAMLCGTASNYIDFYIKDVRKRLLEGELFEIKSQQDAIEFLRGNYKFQAFAGIDKARVVDAYMALVESAVKLTDSERQKTKNLLTHAYIYTDSVYNDFRRGEDTPLFDLNSIPILYGEGKQEVIKSVIDADNACLHNAVAILMRTVPNVDSEGRYRYYKDYFDVIFDKVFNTHSPSKQ